MSFGWKCEFQRQVSKVWPDLGIIWGLLEKILHITNNPPSSTSKKMPSLKRLCISVFQCFDLGSISSSNFLFPAQLTAVGEIGASLAVELGSGTTLECFFMKFLYEISQFLAHISKTWGETFSSGTIIQLWSNVMIVENGEISNGLGMYGCTAMLFQTCATLSLR